MFEIESWVNELPGQKPDDTSANITQRSIPTEASQD